MDDGTGALLQHRWQETAIQADRRVEIQVKRLLPVVVRQGKRAAAWCGGTTDRIDQDVETAEPIESGLDDPVAPLASADIRLDKLIRGAAGRYRPGGGQDRRAPSSEPLHDGRADALGPASNECPFPLEFG